MRENTPLKFDIHELINEFDLGTVLDVRTAEGGAVNENWIVRTTSDTVVVRGVEKNLSLSDIRFEQALIQALGRHGFPFQLPQPLQTKRVAQLWRRMVSSIGCIGISGVQAHRRPKRSL